MIGAAWFAAALLWCVRDRSLASEVTAEGAMLPVLFGFLRSESASRRKYGDLTEKKCVARFQAAAPPDWNVEDDVQVDYLGNVDLLVALPNGRRCPIEIKSWQSTGYRLRFNRALRQVRRQRDALLAQNAVLWLPEAKIPQCWLPTRHRRRAGRRALSDRVPPEAQIPLRRSVSAGPAARIARAALFDASVPLEPARQMLGRAMSRSHD